MENDNSIEKLLKVIEPYLNKVLKKGTNTWDNRIILIKIELQNLVDRYHIQDIELFKDIAKKLEAGKNPKEIIESYNQEDRSYELEKFKGLLLFALPKGVELYKGIVETYRTLHKKEVDLLERIKEENRAAARVQGFREDLIVSGTTPRNKSANVVANAKKAANAEEEKRRFNIARALILDGKPGDARKVLSWLETATFKAKIIAWIEENHRGDKDVHSFNIHFNYEKLYEDGLITLDELNLARFADDADLKEKNGEQI